MHIRELFNPKSKIQESGKALVSKGTARQESMFSDDNKQVSLMKDYKTAYENIPLITSIIDVHADQIVQDFFFIGPNKEKLTDWADKLNLGYFLHKMVKSLLIYGNSYVEIVKNGDNVDEMKIINPIWMEVYRKQTGEVLGYGQIIDSEKKILWGSTGSQDVDKTFGKIYPLNNQIVHFKHNVISSEKYGMSIIRPLLASLRAKTEMEQNLGKILGKYAAPLIVATVGNDQFPANETVVSTISNTLKDLQAESELTVSHLVKLETLDFGDKGIDLATPIEHVEQQIITGGNVPPVLLGRFKDKMDKSSAEVALRGFGRRIKAIQREVKINFEDKIIKEQGLGEEKDKMIWEAADEREWENTVDIIRGLVTDGILTPQKANDLLPPRYAENLPEIQNPLNGNAVIDTETGQQKPRPNQMKAQKITDNPNDPTKTTKNPKSNSRRIVKTDKMEKSK